MRILIVDDDGTIRDSLKKGLEKEAFIIDVAEDGERGSFLARTNEYDAVLLDNVMPKKLGADVCKDIRKSQKSTPIIMVSVNKESATKIELLNCGADDYIVKPFDMQEVVARIRAILRRPRRIREQIETLDTLRVDLRRHQVTRSEREIYLTRKEFAILEILLRHAGTVVPRQQIMEHAWDINADPFSNTLETHIRTLRRKIDCPGEKKLIHTVPGRGYKVFAAEELVVLK